MNDPSLFLCAVQLCRIGGKVMPLNSIPQSDDTDVYMLTLAQASVFSGSIRIFSFIPNIEDVFLQCNRTDLLLDVARNYDFYSYQTSILYELQSYGITNKRSISYMPAAIQPYSNNILLQPFPAGVTDRFINDPYTKGSLLYS